ncbi:helix-turn-helix domain-containing protein, partial [Pseudanabaena sp. CCNP1317]|uniref:helix-turn-helix domain-containing protein n=2 Tax=Pseudanabaena TaxID=1152 RepID=UPI002B1F4EBD
MNNQNLDNQKSSSISPQVAEYIRLYTEANYPIRDIAKQCKTSVSTVYNAMVAAGFKEFRPRHSRASHTRMSMEQQAIALYQSGLTRSAIVQKLNVAARTLNKILEKHNIPIRRGID